MDALPLTEHAIHKAEMEYHGNFWHTLGRIQHIAIMSRIDLSYETCHLATLTVSPTLPSFQVMNHYVHYLASHPHKPIFILIILMMDQISSGLHGVGIKLKTTQPRIFGMSSICISWQNYQQKTVSVGYYTYSGWCFCLLKSKDSTSYRIWIHWWWNYIHV